MSRSNNFCRWVKENTEPFVPTRVQTAILEALDSAHFAKSASKTKRATTVDNFARNGAKETTATQDSQTLTKRLGFYRPDSPPPELKLVK